MKKSIFARVIPGVLSLSLTLSLSIPAYSEPELPPREETAAGYPSWEDVRKAKENEASKQQEVENITKLIGELNDKVKQAAAAAGLAAEKYQEAKIRLDEANERSVSLGELVKNSRQAAEISRREAGKLVASMYKGGSADTNLLFAADSNSTEFLELLTLVDRIGERSQTVYSRALKDANAASALQQQADEARADFERIAEEAQEALRRAHEARESLMAAVKEQEERSRVMVAQLAELQGTSESVQERYLAGVQERREQERRAREAAERRRLQQEAAARAAAARSSNSRTNSAGGNVDVVMANNPPRSDVVASVLHYARGAMGTPYVFGGSTHDGFDCSGLTMMAYRAAGINIGTHSVNNQYYVARGRSQLVSYDDREPGDLIFWGGGPGSFYHIGIYVGDDMMIAAPDVGDVVKLQRVWGSPWWQVARPAM